MAQAPSYMDATSLIAPDIAAQQLQLARRQQMADLLRQQALSPIGDTQSIGGWAIKKSPFEGLSKIAQALMANDSQNSIDAQNLDLSKQYQGRLADLINGGQAPAGALGPTNAAASALDANGGNVQAALTPQTAPSGINMASTLRAMALHGISPEMASAYADNFKTPDSIKVNQFLGIGNDQARQLELAKRNKEGTQSVPDNGYLVLPNGQIMWGSDIKGGTYTATGPNGQPVSVPIAGATENAATRAGAIKRAEESASDPFKAPTVVQTVNGPVLMTPSQQRSAAYGGIDSAYPPEPNISGSIAPVPVQKLLGISNPQERSNIAALSGSSSSPQLASEAQLAADKARAEAGVAQSTKPQLDYSTNAAQKFQEMGNNINSHLSDSQSLLQRIGQSRDALTRFKAGGGADVRANLAQFAQGFPGMPQGVVDGIAGGDLSAVQEFQKFAAQEALGTMQQALASDNGPSSKGNRMAMELFIKNNPNITTDPRAIEKIFNFQTQLHDDALKHSDFYANYVTQNQGNPSALDPNLFANQWAHEQINSGRVRPEQVTGKALGTTVRRFNPATGTFQ